MPLSFEDALGCEDACDADDEWRERCEWCPDDEVCGPLPPEPCEVWDMAGPSLYWLLA